VGGIFDMWYHYIYYTGDNNIKKYTFYTEALARVSFNNDQSAYDTILYNRGTVIEKYISLSKNTWWVYWENYGIQQSGYTNNVDARTYYNSLPGNHYRIIYHEGAQVDGHGSPGISNMMLA